MDTITPSPAHAEAFAEALLAVYAWAVGAPPEGLLPKDLFRALNAGLGRQLCSISHTGWFPSNPWKCLLLNF